MSAVTEDVVTSEQAATLVAEAAPSIAAQSPENGTHENGVGMAASQPQPAAAPAPAAQIPAPAVPQREESAMSQSDYESMFKELSEGDVVVGTVVHIDKDGVLVDVGSKSEGIIRLNELSREPFDSVEDVVQVTEQVKVVVIGRTAEGPLLLSKKRADFAKAWDKVIEAMNAGTILQAMVTERVKGAS